MWIRFVLVPGLTDDPAIAGGIAEFASGLGNVERVDVLPFHQMGRFKWEALGLPYSLNDVTPPSQECAREHRGHLPRTRADRVLTSRSQPAIFGGNVWDASVRPIP